ncbi:MAG TPA: GNAT family N-acetyltransferase [Terriglobales bacterium]|nr:GNAT family N-acetyltransferase [Terriglobales bacterium]
MTFSSALLMPQGHNLELRHAQKAISSQTTIAIRELTTFDDLRKIEEVEKTVWNVSDQDLLPLTFIVASKEAGSIWLGAFEGSRLVGFAFAFLGRENGRGTLHSHMLAVREQYRDLNLGYKLKLAQRDRALALGIQQITWTFDPLQSKNAHLNFAKLGVVSAKYKIDFYGPETSSTLHRNGTDRLWVEWHLASKHVQQRLQGKTSRAEVLEILSRLQPLVGFDGSGRPARNDLAAALARQRISIEIPGDINLLQEKDPQLAREWRLATRWAFMESVNAGFFVAEFCRSIRGKQGPSAYLLQKGPIEEFIPQF